MNKDLEQYFNSLGDLDVRKSRNARFADQKCLPDVICAVAECILVYTTENHNRSFNKNDIWFSPYANQLISESFSKPNLSAETAQSEYDKFFAQPMKMFAYAGLLDENKIGNINTYTIRNRNILEFISLRERNALEFLNAYLSKVMRDSGLFEAFENFFEEQDKHSLVSLRDILMDFYHTYTPVQGGYEPPRIFNKFINILAFKRGLKGVDRGFLSKNPLTIDSIRYNSINWRDVGKDKRLTRQEYMASAQNEINKNDGYYRYQIEKAKRFVKNIEPCSEIHRFSAYPASQAHHIFMASEYPTIADCPENIICITPNQHFYRAHPNNHTSIIDRDYQIVCLLCKLDSIEINFRAGNDNYSFDDFKNVLNVGMETDIFTPQMDFEEVKYSIMKQAYYQRRLND